MCNLGCQNSSGCKVESLELRPHHALCIRFFKGHGYSPDFTENMRRIILRLESGEMVQLVSGTDSVCSACPENQNGTCKSQERVQDFDSAVLVHSGLKLGSRISWNDICDCIETTVLQPEGVFGSICGDCQWSALCH